MGHLCRWTTKRICQTPTGAYEVITPTPATKTSLTRTLRYQISRRPTSQVNTRRLRNWLHRGPSLGPVEVPRRLPEDSETTKSTSRPVVLQPQTQSSFGAIAAGVGSIQQKNSRLMNRSVEAQRWRQVPVKAISLTRTLSRIAGTTPDKASSATLALQQ